MSMLSTVLKKFFGTNNDRYLRSLQPIVAKINSLEPEFQSLSDADLRTKTDEFKIRLAQGETLDSLLPEAFATVREAAKRTLGQRHYDVQLIGGIVLHQGKIAEMRTGEGKTLVSTLPSYLNALTGNGVHLVTVNDYLASRDAAWMSKVHTFLGLSVGVILHGQSFEEKQAAYNCDITYGTNNEFGFDYLRDNMRFSLEEMAQRPFNFAIIDEVDSILVDEARTPLIISGPVEDRTDLYVRIDKFIPTLKAEDFELDEKANSVILTDEGINHLEKEYAAAGLIEQGTTLYDIQNILPLHHTNQALRAHKLFTRDKDYLIQEGGLHIIDEFTGRIMEGRRYSDGLHQALEAKEGVKIQNENQTLASVTYQNYFRMYPKIGGMTGTAMTEANEFSEIYNLECVEIPTNKPIARIDEDDKIFRTEEEKFIAITEIIKSANAKGQPVLAGTASVEKSELLSKHLKKNGIKHNVLNAKQHQSEAFIVAQAGRSGAVTVATNMAGRGTDIQLGGNLEMMLAQASIGITDEAELEKIKEKLKADIEADKQKVLAAGGLFIVGTERHENRRIDNQLRGRAGRQGDPGYSIFYLSAQDDLIRIFGADKKMDWVLGKMGVPNEPIEHPLLTRMMEKAQAKVEARNFEIRKNLLKYDDVMNAQRTAIYKQRKEIMNATDVRPQRDEMIDEQIDSLVSTYIPKNTFPEQWQPASLKQEIQDVFNVRLPIESWCAEDGIAEEEIFDRIVAEVEKFQTKRDVDISVDEMKALERRLMLFTLDEVWKDHLHTLDNLRQGINLRAYAQKDPLNEYKKEAFQEFKNVIQNFRVKYLQRLFHVQIHAEQNTEELLRAQKLAQRMHETRQDPAASGISTAAGYNPALSAGEGGPQTTIRSHVSASDRDPANPDTWGKIARNEVCPCGSGRKYKQCHGKV